MTKKITPNGKMSKEEFIKSSRDAVLTALAGLVPALLTLVESTDFGEYNFIFAGILAMIAPFVNRLLNLMRV